MKRWHDTSRRGFLKAGLAVPAALEASAPAGGELPARILGRTGLKVTTLGFGCAWTAEPAVFTHGLELGVNHFDTAPIYQGGNNEAQVRAGIGKRRREIVLSTKTEANSRERALGQLEQSLKELGTDYVDIWYLHGKDRPEGLRDDLLEAQAAAKKQGKTRFIGVSTHRLPAMAPAILKAGCMDVVLAAYNFTMAPEVRQAAVSLAKAGIGLVDMKVAAGGTALSQWPGSNRPPVLRSPRGVAASLRWVLRDSLFASALVGMQSAEDVEEDRAAALTPYGPEDEKLLAHRLEEIRPVYCRMCGRCDGQCPKGLPVSDILRFAMYADGYGQVPSARDAFRRLPPALRKVRCTDCASCSVRCPNGVRVKERLTLAQEWLA